VALVDLFKSGDLRGKSLAQIVGFAGDGKLADGGDASREFREWLAYIPLAAIRKNAEECLTGAFTNSGLALQDIINQIGKRLGFEVEEGRYRGSRDAIGFDGLWRLPGERAIVVEVKTTDAYAINLDSIANYRRRLVAERGLDAEKISVLLVVGRGDTGGLEAQIRGSRHAWDMRLISVDALLKIAEIKEKVEEPTFERIHEVLIPKEFTKLDDIAELVLSTARDSGEDEEPAAIKSDDDGVGDGGEAPTESLESAAESAGESDTPVSFHQSCVVRAQAAIERQGALSSDLLRRSNTTYSTADGKCGAVCLVSKSHERGEGYFWFSFRPHQKAFLEKAERGYLILGCGIGGAIYLIPAADFLPMLDSLRMTRGDRPYWHIHIIRRGGRWVLYRKIGFDDVDLACYHLSA
jgi:hypothetical protein